jgi:TnpA family transposase
MPVSFLTDNEREQLRCFPAEISLSDLTAFFTLSITDMALVQKQREEHNRLGFSLQLCTLRYLGFSPLLPEGQLGYFKAKKQFLYWAYQFIVLF